MKTFQNFIDTAMLNEDLINEDILKDLFTKFKTLFKASGEAYKGVLKSSFQKAYPKWYSAYEKLQNEKDIDAAKKQLDELLSSIDKMEKDDSGEKLDDNKKAVKKLITIGGVRKQAEDKKLDDLVKYCDTKIAEVTKAQPVAAKNAEQELKQPTDNAEKPINPAQAAVEDPQQKKETQQLAAALGIDNNDYEEVAKKLQGMITPVGESLNEAKQNAEQWRNLFKTVVKRDKEHGNEVLLALLLSYKKLKEILPEVKPAGVSVFLSAFDNAKEVEVKK